MTDKHEIIQSRIQATQLDMIRPGSLFCLFPAKDEEIFVCLGPSCHREEFVRCAVLGADESTLKDGSTLVFPLKVESVKASMYR